MRWAFAVSTGLHAAAALLMTNPSGGRPHAEAPPIEVELLQQPPAEQGVPAPQAARPPPKPDNPAPPPAEQGEGVPPPTTGSPPSRTGQPAVNLGNADRDLEGMAVSGKNIVPPAPDAVFRNKAPVYPPAAVRRGEAGTVYLLVRVSALGVPDQVVVAGSSGTVSLDRAARDAVLLWRFRPATAGGTSVPFDYQLKIIFK